MDTPLKKPTIPIKYKTTQNTGLVCTTIIITNKKHCINGPVANHLPTCMRLNNFEDSHTPVSDPAGDNNNDKPSDPSVNPNRCLIAGKAATHMPTNRLPMDNRKPRRILGLCRMKAFVFFNMFSKRED